MFRSLRRKRHKIDAKPGIDCLQLFFQKAVQMGRLPAGGAGADALGGADAVGAVGREDKPARALAGFVQLRAKIAAEFFKSCFKTFRGNQGVREG